MESNLSNFMQIEKAKNKILIFDFHNLCYRTIFVAANEFRNNQTKVFDRDPEMKDLYQYWKHIVLNAFFYNSLEKNPSKIIIAVDERNSWRKKVYSGYKENRAKSREDSLVDFGTFFPIMNEFINNLKEMFPNVYILKVNECEADDIIAVLTAELAKDDNRIELISTDKDFYQLHKFKNFKQFNPIKKEYVVSMNPKKDLEVKILTGDKGDDIPAVRERLGEKTAEKLLNEGLEELLQDEVVKKNFIRNRELIDFDYIPANLKEKIIQEYKNYPLNTMDRSIIWAWLLREKLKKLADEFQKFVLLFNNLNS